MNDSIILQGTTTEKLVELLTESVQLQFQKFKQDQISSTESNELLTRSETCDFLKINSTTLWHWTNKKKVKAYGIGHRRYYKKAELLECLVELNQ